MRIVLVGATGFVGQAIANALVAGGHEPVTIKAPRLQTKLRMLEGLLHEAADLEAQLDLPAIRDADALINAAGLAEPEAAATDELIGANALLPTVLALKASRAGIPRMVHVSSAAVYGRTRTLDELAEPDPHSPYAASKLLGDITLKNSAAELQTVVYRPTSVHGPKRKLTQALIRFANSAFSSVAGTGDRPTPQALVENVAGATIFLATCPLWPTHPVVHPWEGLTTAELLRVLSGKEPRHIPESLASACLRSATKLGQIHPRADAQARRLEMLWFGQHQTHSWLTNAGYQPVASWSSLPWT